MERFEHLAVERNGRPDNSKEVPIVCQDNEQWVITEARFQTGVDHVPYVLVVDCCGNCSPIKLNWIIVVFLSSDLCGASNDCDRMFECFSLSTPVWIINGITNQNWDMISQYLIGQTVMGQKFEDSTKPQMSIPLVTTTVSW